MSESYHIRYRTARDHYFPTDELDLNANPLFRIAHEVWAPGSTYEVCRQEGVTWLQVGAGGGTWEIGTQKGALRRGQLLCYGLQVPCRILIRQALELRLIYTHASGTTPAQDYGLLPGTVVNLGKAASPCWSLLKQILACALGDAFGKQRIANSLMRVWLDWIASVHHAHGTGCTIAGEAKRWIDSNFENIRTLEEVARHCSCSAEHLSRLFREEHQESPWHYIRRRQMQLAADILRHGRVRIEEMAERLGYSERYAFTKAFKNYNGMSPGRLMKAQASSAGERTPG